MKEIKLFFTALLVPLVFHAAWADDATDVARAATRRSVSAITAERPQKKSEHPTVRGTNSGRDTVQARERTTTRDASKSNTNIRTTQPSNRVVTRATGTTSNRPQNIATRGAVKSRAATTSGGRPSVSAPTTPSATQSRSAGARTGISRAATISRNATLQNAILSRDYSKCRGVFNDCMDEFCANKDSLLKRCACSTRVNEFTSVQRDLDAVEEKLLDFSQRLITVNMNREDVIALNQATPGELAYTTADKSKSQQMLDEITKKLNASFDDDNFTQGLNAISLSLDTNAAFDNVDSFAGASTTTKTGTELYIAALPTCRKMAAEVCTPDELAIAESGYQMMIEQDCNTVSKSYQNQTDLARSKIFESSALLDMSRLDIHQQRNSDDILTCKKKMLTMLTDSNVCGENMGKCLDTTGRYIDPTTGTAFLTSDLANLAYLISRPENGQTWSNAPGNNKFVTFMNSKKVFLESATENCQDISDYVWESFIEDALAQIKLAQDKKLEEMRQSCTTLTAQCLDDAFDSISKFDARALSTFGVIADKTVNGMCSDIRTACTALLETTGGGNDEWGTGIEQIATEKTYDTILSTCREVGRACIIDACTSISGNFGLCENIDTSINRKSIINRTACWNEVVDCIASAGSETLATIMSNHNRNATRTTGHIYNILYGEYIISNPDYQTQTIADSEPSNSAAKQVFDICSRCGTDGNLDCNTCRLAEQIWGNCEHSPNHELYEDDSTNKILVMASNDKNATLLSWFARNTGTNDAPDSCRDTSCPIGTQLAGNGICQPSNLFTSEGMYCPYNNDNDDDNNNGNTNIMTIFADGTDKFTNCCSNQTNTAKTMKNNNCCYTPVINAKTGEIASYKTSNATTTNSLQICAPSENATNAHIVLTTNEYSLICVGTLSGADINAADGYPSGQTIKCDGEYIMVYNNGIHNRPEYTETTTNTPSTVYNLYYGTNSVRHKYNHTTRSWPDNKTPNVWHIEYATSDSNLSHQVSQTNPSLGDIVVKPITTP